MLLKRVCHPAPISKWDVRFMMYLLEYNPLTTEPSVVLKRCTSSALAFQGSSKTICKLSYIFEKMTLSNDLSSL